MLKYSKYKTTTKVVHKFKTQVKHKNYNTASTTQLRQQRYNTGATEEVKHMY